jgi:hypothetical protein
MIGYGYAAGAGLMLGSAAAMIARHNWALTAVFVAVAAVLGLAGWWRRRADR